MQHKYLVGYMYMGGRAADVGNIVLTVADPVESEQDVDKLTAHLRNFKRLPSLQVVGLFKLER